MWTILFSILLLFFSVFLIIIVKRFIEERRMLRLEREIENDLKEDFTDPATIASGESDEFLNWLEDLQSENDIVKSKEQR